MRLLHRKATTEGDAGSPSESTYCCSSSSSCLCPFFNSSRESSPTLISLASSVPATPASTAASDLHSFVSDPREAIHTVSMDPSPAPEEDVCSVQSRLEGGLSGDIGLGLFPSTSTHDRLMASFPAQMCHSGEADHQSMEPSADFDEPSDWYNDWPEHTHDPPTSTPTLERAAALLTPLSMTVVTPTTATSEYPVVRHSTRSSVSYCDTGPYAAELAVDQTDSHFHMDHLVDPTLPSVGFHSATLTPGLEGPASSPYLHHGILYPPQEVLSSNVPSPRFERFESHETLPKVEPLSPSAMQDVAMSDVPLRGRRASEPGVRRRPEAGAQTDPERRRRRMTTEETAYKCEECSTPGRPKYFAKLHNLTDHMLRHNRQRSKRYRCFEPTCDLAFDRRADLSRHERVGSPSLLDCAFSTDPNADSQRRITISLLVLWQEVPENRHSAEVSIVLSPAREDSNQF